MRTRILLVTLVAVLCAPAAAQACSLAYVPPAERVRAVDVAVYGRVLSRTLVAPSPPGRLDATYRYRISVVRTYKGRSRRTVDVVGTQDSGICGLGILTVGRHVGLLLRGGRSPFFASTGSLISRAELEQAVPARARRAGRAGRAGPNPRG
jgi:hypothetical protein